MKKKRALPKPFHAIPGEWCEERNMESLELSPSCPSRDQPSLEALSFDQTNNDTPSNAIKRRKACNVCHGESNSVMH